MRNAPEVVREVGISRICAASCLSSARLSALGCVDYDIGAANLYKGLGFLCPLGGCSSRGLARPDRDQSRRSWRLVGVGYEMNGGRLQGVAQARRPLQAPSRRTR